jgi:signal transduction histidine kinase
MSLFVGGQIRFGLDRAPGSAIVNSNPIRLHEAMSNLVDNAIRYRSRNGGIAVGKAPGFNGCCLCDEATDRDPDIPAAETVLVLELFGRSRLTRNHDGDGLGPASYWRLRAGLSQALKFVPGIDAADLVSIGRGRSGRHFPRTDG